MVSSLGASGIYVCRLAVAELLDELPGVRGALTGARGLQVGPGS